jgi:hypothetical protein
MASKCYRCSKELSESFKIMVSRSDSCPHCMADIRSCKMCSFYDPKSYNECRESNADRITEKEKANFCDYFKFGPGTDDADKARLDALAKAAALFKK